MKSKIIVYLLGLTSFIQAGKLQVFFNQFFGKDIDSICKNMSISYQENLSLKFLDYNEVDALELVVRSCMVRNAATKFGTSKHDLIKLDTQIKSGHSILSQVIDKKRNK